MIIYTAGPIRPKNGHTYQENLDEAKRVSHELWVMGYGVICPHANTNLTDEPDYSVGWLKGDLEMISRCDALVMLPRWDESEGAIQEKKYAEKRDIPVFIWPDIPLVSPTEHRRPLQANAFIDTVMKMYRVHLKKNEDYSPANILGAGEIGLMTRTWDKVARLMNLFGFRIEIASMEFESPKKPKCESIEDTILDLSVYAIIWQLLRRGVWGK